MYVLIKMWDLRFRSVPNQLQFRLDWYSIFSWSRHNVRFNFVEQIYQIDSATSGSIWNTFRVFRQFQTKDLVFSIPSALVVQWTLISSVCENTSGEFRQASRQTCSQYVSSDFTQLIIGASNRLFKLVGVSTLSNCRLKDGLKSDCLLLRSHSGEDGDESLWKRVLWPF